MYQAFEKRFIRINLIAIISLFVLILAGGVVRSSGAGMGCPDWPKCFDQYVPPTHVSQLPAGYEHKYVEGRVAKNQRFAKTLDVLGYAELAERIRNDRSILQPEEFNVTKTWTEYINRLIGALTGFFLLGCVIFSFPYLRSRKRIFFLSLFNVFLVGFQAWMGSIVVSTNLTAWLVTVHMLLALAILAISIYTFDDARTWQQTNRVAVDWKLRLLALILFFLIIIQVTLGTEVREAIDAIAKSLNHLQRETWVSKVGEVFSWHRSLTSLTLFLAFLLERRINKVYSLHAPASWAAFAMLMILGAQLLAGIALAYLALPPMAQALHIVLASLLFGAQFYVLLSLGRGPLKKEAGLE